MKKVFYNTIMFFGSLSIAIVIGFTTVSVLKPTPYEKMEEEHQQKKVESETEFAPYEERVNEILNSPQETENEFREKFEQKAEEMRKEARETYEKNVEDMLEQHKNQ